MEECFTSNDITSAAFKPDDENIRQSDHFYYGIHRLNREVFPVSRAGIIGCRSKTDKVAAGKYASLNIGGKTG